MSEPWVPDVIHSSVTESRVIKLMEAELYTLDNPGICLECGADHDACEPDAYNYECHECGEHYVFGAAEIMLQGHYWSKNTTRINVVARPENMYPYGEDS